MKRSIYTVSLTILTLFSAWLHFVNLGWGAPFFFHPDEQNIAAAVSGMHFPLQMNPHFFAYGSLPLYTIYFLGVLLSRFATTVTLPQAILLGRFISAVLATAMIPLVYVIGQKLQGRQTGLLAAVITTLSVGIIQFSHFATFEMWLTFFSLLLFWCCLGMLDKKQSLLPVIAAGIVFGMLVATKVSSLVLLPLCIVPLFRHFPKRGESQKGRFLLIQIPRALLLFGIAALVFLITNPFTLLDFSSFHNSIAYESGVAIGTLPVFYTQEFIKTSPVIFQLLHVFPFLLNPINEAIGIASFGIFIILCIKTRSAKKLLLLLFFLVLFLPQAVLFVKWTRYMVPTLPFIALLTASAIFSLSKKRTALFFTYCLITIITVSGSIFTLAFLKTVYFSDDSRILAAHWAKSHLPTGAAVLSETYDLGIIPFNQYFPKITLFNFYSLDQNSSQKAILEQQLHASDVIVLPSQRLIKTRLLTPKRFPNSALFYLGLTNQTLGFKKVYETPCPLLCHILYLSNPVFSYEETASVFDHPTIMIYKRQ